MCLGAGSEADIGRIEAETGAASARAEANRASAGYTGAQTDSIRDQVSRRDVEGERRDVQISQQDRALSIEEDKLKLMEQQYRDQVIASGLSNWDEGDQRAWDATIKFVLGQTEAFGLIQDQEAINGVLDSINETHNRFRQVLGKPPLRDPGQQGQGLPTQNSGPRQVIELKHIQQLIKEGSRPEDLLRLFSTFTLTPEAVQEVTRILQESQTQR